LPCICTYIPYVGHIFPELGEIFPYLCADGINGVLDVTIGINITIQASFYGFTASIQNRTDLCSFGSLSYSKSDNDDAYRPSCPLKKGSYELFTSFTVPQFFRDKTLDFTPDLHLEFIDGDDGTLIGCADTGTRAMMDNARQHSLRGSRAFVFCILLFLVLFAICLVGHGRKRRAGSTPGTNRSAAVVRRYHYRRTTRNGKLLVPNLSESDGSSIPSSRASSSLQEVT
jgi:hypothetical protein